MENVILLTDSYKVSHAGQYPPKCTHIYSYFESRGGLYPETVFFGLQYTIKKYLSGPVVTAAHIAEAEELYSKHFGTKLLNVEGWRRIVEKHQGRLPLRIRALPEGTVVPTHNVMFTVENTDEELPWLTNWFETILVQLWYPITVATNSRAWKKTIARYLFATSGSLATLDFKLHDFGYRGVSSVETAGIGGAAHLVNFKGTDTVAALLAARKYYGADMPGFSIPASEHSTITSWGQAGELDAYSNMLDRFPDVAFACVSDSYNIWKACSELWGGALKERVKARKLPIVIRPDSGKPPEVVVKCLHLLGAAFGTTTNANGYKLLPPFIRIIQGDGIDGESLEWILFHIVKFGWSSENVAFGSGGALLQRLHRDTQKCAYKCSAAVVDGTVREVFKAPIGDLSKTSKKGYFTVERVDGMLKTLTHDKPTTSVTDELRTVFENGRLLIDTPFDEVCANAQLTLPEYTQPLRHDERCPDPTCALCDPEAWSKWVAEWKRP
eukprot:m.91413 g.91413  ORF g.91413 m.91413 type:complete len:497 (+) comp13735_c1_seq1:214-1704(+)